MIDFLAQVQGRDADEVRSELEVAGQELPVDSILVAEIVTRVEERFGITINANAEVARATRSVCSFADVIVQALDEKGKT